MPDARSTGAIAHVVGGVGERCHQALLHVLREAAGLADLGHRQAHAREPLIAHLDADWIRQVARAQARVAETFDVAPSHDAEYAVKVAV